MSKSQITYTCAVTVWNACRVDADLHCIKGGGACQLREKVLAEVARTFVFLSFPCGSSVNLLQVHRRRRLPEELGHLGNQCELSRYNSHARFAHVFQKYTSGVPIEVSPFAQTSVLRSLHTKLDSPKATLRMARAKAGPVVTDNGNFIIDAPFSEAALKNPREVPFMLSPITFFADMRSASCETQAADRSC
jgi:ribose 5-phosphate isomerase A